MSEYDTADETPKPATATPRKGQGRMKQAELQRLIDGILTDAEQLVDGELSPERAKATNYYLGKKFGNEEEGRSQVVITEVRDTVHGIMPSLLRIFFGPERVVEMAPRTAAGVQIAKQATDYIQYVFAEDNKGFLRTYDVLKDGLVRKIGIFKYWWDKSSKRSYREEGLDYKTALALAARDDVTITLSEEYEPDADEANEGDEPRAESTWTLEYTVAIEGKPCIVAVPPEEFIFNRGARDPEEAQMLGHRMEKERGELIALGISEKDLDAHGGADSALAFNTEAIERSSSITQPNTEPDAGEANKKIIYTEAYTYIDVDGDGEAELRRICTIGPEHYVVVNEPIDDRPFAIFCPIPEPHTLLGQSVADLTMDLQLVKSSLVRSMNDSLALSIFPRMGFVEGMVNVEDLLNTEIGAPIRMKRESAVQVISHPFTGEAAMPILQYFDEVSENRTGRNKGAMGLDADALQSSTDGAVGAAIAASQEQTEMIARIFAEQTLKPLFRGIYKLLVKYRPAKRLVRLRGDYTEIDTTQWEADMDVTVNVALGSGDVQKRIAALGNVLAKQEGWLQMFGPGPDNPLTSVQQYRETFARIVELSGFKDVSTFVKQIPANWQPPQPQGPPPPSPEQVLAQAQLQIEQMKTQKDLQIKQAELSLKQQQQQFDQELEIRKMAQDFTLRRYQIDAQFHADYTQATLETDAAQEEAALRGAMDVHRMRHEHAMSQREQAAAEQAQAHDQALERDSQAHDQAMAAQAAASQAAPQDGTE
jgi:hypothetical protein